MTLSAELAKFDEIENAEILEVLKDGEFCKTEKVMWRGQTCIRKTYSSEVSSLSFSALDELALERLRARGAHLQGVIDFVEVAGKTILLLEFIEGDSPKPKLDVLRNFNDVANALEFLHSKNVVHRDVKPSNIIVNSGGAWLIDLGIARELDDVKSQDTTLFGTRTFAPPEQFGYAQTDARSDVYALGMTLYWMFAGKTSEKPLQVDEIKEECDKYSAALAKATSFNPEDRYQSVAEFQTAINHPKSGLLKAVESSRSGARVAGAPKLSQFASKVWNFIIIAFWLLILASSIYGMVMPDPVHNYNLAQRIFEFALVGIAPSTIFGYCLLYKRYLPNLKSFTVAQTVLIFVLTVVLMVAVLVVAMLIGFI